MKNAFYVYILYSNKLKKYYVGSTNNLERRISEHSNGRSRFTSITNDWILVEKFEFDSRKDAMRFEMKVKKRGCKRFLLDV